MYIFYFYKKEKREKNKLGIIYSKKPKQNKYKLIIILTYKIKFQNYFLYINSNICYDILYKWYNAIRIKNQNKYLLLFSNL